MFCKPSIERHEAVFHLLNGQHLREEWGERRGGQIDENSVKAADKRHEAFLHLLKRKQLGRMEGKGAPMDAKR